MWKIWDTINNLKELFKTENRRNYKWWKLALKTGMVSKLYSSKFSEYITLHVLVLNIKQTFDNINIFHSAVWYCVLIWCDGCNRGICYEEYNMLIYTRYLLGFICSGVCLEKKCIWCVLQHWYFEMTPKVSLICRAVIAETSIKVIDTNTKSMNLKKTSGKFTVLYKNWQNIV